jgi:hypothetical protein
MLAFWAKLKLTKTERFNVFLTIKTITIFHFFLSPLIYKIELQKASIFIGGFFLFLTQVKKSVAKMAKRHSER